MRENLVIFHFNFGRDIFYNLEDNGLESLSLWRVLVWRLVGFLIDIWPVSKPAVKAGDDDEIPF